MTKRDKKISVLITGEARNALDAAVLEYDSPQGKLINRMILNFCGVTNKPKEKKVKRSKSKSYPSNFDDQFELLWCAKGKKGSKQKARDIYREMAEGETNEVLEAYTKELMDDLINKQHEPGYKERMLTSYLNGTYWE